MQRYSRAFIGLLVHPSRVKHWGNCAFVSTFWVAWKGHHLLSSLSPTRLHPLCPFSLPLFFLNFLSPMTRPLLFCFSGTCHLVRGQKIKRAFIGLLGKLLRIKHRGKCALASTSLVVWKRHYPANWLCPLWKCRVLLFVLRDIYSRLFGLSCLAQKALK